MATAVPRNVNGEVAISGVLPSGATNSPALGTGGTASNVLVGIHMTANSGTSPTLTVKLQDSADASSWTDLAGATTAALTPTGNAVLYGRSPKAFVRVVATVGGSATPTVTATISAHVFAEL